MCCRRRGEVLGGDRRRLREVYIIYASAGVSLKSDGSVVIAQFDLAFAENGSEVTVAELAY